MKMMQVTPSKQWIHFFRSERCPPTSNILGRTREGQHPPTPCPAPGTSPHWGPGPHLKLRSLKENWVSMMPVVLTRERSTSCSVGT